MEEGSDFLGLCTDFWFRRVDGIWYTEVLVEIGSKDYCNVTKTSSTRLRWHLIKLSNSSSNTETMVLIARYQHVPCRYDSPVNPHSQIITVDHSCRKVAQLRQGGLIEEL